jgi:hypothetical protein
MAPKKAVKTAAKSGAKRPRSAQEADTVEEAATQAALFAAPASDGQETTESEEAVEDIPEGEAPDTDEVVDDAPDAGLPRRRLSKTPKGEGKEGGEDKAAKDSAEKLKAAKVLAEKLKATEDKAKKLKAADDKRSQQRLLLALTGKPNASEDQKNVGILYRAEGKGGSDVKDAVLANFLGDKSCRWYHEVVESHVQSNERSDSSLHGYGSRYDVAGLLHLNEAIPEQKALLDCVCEELPQEGEWSSENPIERSYAKMGYARYRIDRNELSKWIKKDVRKEGVRSTKA